MKIRLPMVHLTTRAQGKLRRKRLADTLEKSGDISLYIDGSLFITLIRSCLQ